jgi:hypothetical protein
VRRPSIRRRWIGPPAHDWPGFVPLPGVPRGSELRVSGMAMASPLELELAVPAAAIASPVGVYAVLRFIDAIEHAWKQRFLDHLRIALACPRSLDLDRARDQGTLALYVFRSTHEHHRRGAVSRPRSQAVPLTSPSLPTLSTRPRSMSI